MAKQFKIGDRVAWKSGSMGSYTEKVGEVVRIIPANEHPLKDGPIDNYGGGTWRDHETYVVSVPPVKVGSKARSKTYWPRVSYLLLLDN